MRERLAELRGVIGGGTTLSNRFGATEYRISIPGIAESEGTVGAKPSTTTGG